MEAESRTSYFPNDPEAILQKGHYRSYTGYNLQAGINDWNELSVNVEFSRKETGSVPEIIADKGYAKIQEIEAVQSPKGVSGGECSITRKRATEKDRLNCLHFTYNKETDTVICPKGKVTGLKNLDCVNRHGSHYRRNKIRKVHYSNCLLKEVCSNSFQNGRNYYISHNSFLESCKEIEQRGCRS